MIDHGKLTVVDNQVDQTTGTVKLKAEFPNANLQLWPGQFVNVRLLIDTLQAGRGDADRRRAARPERHLRLRRRATTTPSTMRAVTVAQQDEVQAVVANGVEPAERVVTTGFARLTDGSARSTSVASRQTRRRLRPRGRATRQRGSGTRRAQRQSAGGRRRQTRRNERLLALHPAARSRPRCSASR